MLLRDKAFDNISEESTNHCKRDQVTKISKFFYHNQKFFHNDWGKKGNLYEDICFSAHLFLAKDTSTTQKIRMFIL